MLQAVAAPTSAAVILMGHTAKLANSEYSGSTAWEAAVRSRLYFGKRLPDQPETGDDDTPDPPDVRYLCRRKANYAALDWRKVHYINGVMVPETPPKEQPLHAMGAGSRVAYAQDCVLDAIRKLKVMELYGAVKPSPAYLPKLAQQYQLLGGLSKVEFTKAMCQLHLDSKIKTAQVGVYANRTPRMGLVILD
jgi:hypothetical protein